MGEGSVREASDMLLSRKDVQEIVGRSKPTVCRWLAEGRLKGVKEKGAGCEWRWKVWASDLDEAMREWGWDVDGDVDVEGG